jgi:hypothetical protein
MLYETDWVATVIAEARARNVNVPGPVWIRIESLLKGKFSARLVPNIELANLTRQLIDEITDPSPNPSTSHEN